MPAVRGRECRELPRLSAAPGRSEAAASVVTALFEHLPENYKSGSIVGQLHNVRKPPDACNAEGLLTHPLNDTEKEG